MDNDVVSSHGNCSKPKEKIQSVFNYLVNGSGCRNRVQENDRRDAGKMEKQEDFLIFCNQVIMEDKVFNISSQSNRAQAAR